MTIDEMPATSACFWEMEAIMGKNMSPVNSSIGVLRHWMLRDTGDLLALSAAHAARSQALSPNIWALPR